jgi:hypothetical protein
MATEVPVAPDTTWSNLAALDEEGRRTAMTERFRRLASEDEASRLRELEAMVRAEYALPEQELHAFTLSRLRAWIELEEHDPGQAMAIAGAYDKVFDRLPANLAMRRASVVQTVARMELTAEEMQHLDLMESRVLASVPHRSGEGAIRQRVAGDTARQKPWWKFW